MLCEKSKRETWTSGIHPLQRSAMALVYTILHLAPRSVPLQAIQIRSGLFSFRLLVSLSDNVALPGRFPTADETTYHKCSDLEERVSLFRDMITRDGTANKANHRSHRTAIIFQ